MTINKKGSFKIFKGAGSVMHTQSFIGWLGLDTNISNLFLSISFGTSVHIPYKYCN